MGTPWFAVPVLEALHGAGYYIQAVVTQPDRPAGRGRQPAAPPVKATAERLGLPVLQPERIREPATLEKLASLAPDVVITAAYGQILPQRLLDIPARGCLNVHASLLPRWRGAAPIHRALMAGDAVTGVTIMQTVLALDAGPVVGQMQVPVDPLDTYGTLHDKLAQAGARALLDVLPAYLSGERVPVPQPEEGVTYAERLTRADEWIDWNRPAWSVHNQIRALSPRPGACTAWEGQTVKVLKSLPPAGGTTGAPGAQEAPVSDGTAPPGFVRERDGKVEVRCRDGWLPVLEVQPAGKRVMPAGAWLRGVRGQVVFRG
ncbi:MAG: methionyl-tRNA formyltransferase [Alicyclobacillaceae bacterium]|nr:methionyl-tRNA formyltransferase [Alicyclobacillaceae bacterium]